MPPPSRIHPALVETSQLLLLMNNLRVTSADAVRLWALIEAINPNFVGIGYVPTHMNIRADDPKLWPKRRIYFWCLDFAEGCAGFPTSSPPDDDATALENEEAAESKALVEEGGVQKLIPHTNTDLGDDASDLLELTVEDFFARLVQFCTLLDRPRQVKFVFQQLQKINPGVVHRHGDVVHKQELVYLVDVMHGDGPDAGSELEKMLSYANLDDHGCLEYSAFARLNMICKSLLRPMDLLRRQLRARWLGERFWLSMDRAREGFEAEGHMDLGDLLREGHFSKTAFDYAALDASRAPMGIRARRAAIAAAKAKEKEALKALPPPELPAGHRSGEWWREEPAVRRRRLGPPKRAGTPAASTNVALGAPGSAAAAAAAGMQESRVVVEEETADALILVKNAKIRAKLVLKKAKASKK